MKNFTRFAVAAASGTVTIVQFSDAGKPTGKVSVPRVSKSDAEWKQKLTPISFEVTRHAGTERACGIGSRGAAR